MASKAKPARKKPRLVPLDGPTEHRRQHTPFTRDVLTSPGAPVVARHRTRTILTPLAVRLAIIEEVAARPEASRVRSLRRRLTALDRALSDGEAETLDRITSCINSLSNIGCLNYFRSEVRSSPFGRLPFGENKRIEIAAMTFVLKGLSPTQKSAILELAVILDPSHSGAFKPGEEFIALLCSAATAAESLYKDWFRTEKSAGSIVSRALPCAAK
ncbi:MAG: hypothetical protein WCD20_16780 [Rhodomicrobium sp.]